MRKLRKKMVTKTYEVLVYNTKTKQEEVVTISKPEIGHELEMPNNCVEISRELKSEVEKTYIMTPLEFFKHATVEETKEEA